MDAQRRELLKSLATGGAAAALPLAAASSAQAQATSDSPAGQAWLELAAAMAEVEAKHASPPFASADPVDRAEARRFMAHTLQAALEFWTDADPARPVFTRFVGPHKKLLGDNPDALYYFAAIDPKGRYVVRGNVAGAVYTSFTIEKGSGDGRGSKGLTATLNDSEFDVRPDGSYEIVLGGPKLERNWMPLSPDRATITTRHYFEWARPAAADPNLIIPFSISPLDPLPPPPPVDDAFVAANLKRAANFLRAVCVDILPSDVPRPRPSIVAKTPNTFPTPDPNFSNRGTGYAAADNVYVQGEYRLAPDEALVMRGRFPPGRFANVMLWNRYLQTYDFANRSTSLNRRQTKLEADGSFKMVVAHSDPGVPNWLDTEGRPRGVIFWRFMLPVGAIEPIRTKVVKLSQVGAA
jgi:hypothetical protein